MNQNLDLINATFEALAGGAVLCSAYEAWRRRSVVGVHWITPAFFWLWGPLQSFSIPPTRTALEHVLLLGRLYGQFIMADHRCQISIQPRNGTEGFSHLLNMLRRGAKTQAPKLERSSLMTTVAWLVLATTASPVASAIAAIVILIVLQNYFT